VTKRAVFTQAELERYRRFLESVGERVAGVEKRADGSIRLLTANDAGRAVSGLEDGPNEWDEVLRPQ
jgi:hypothetical protein